MEDADAACVLLLLLLAKGTRSALTRLFGCKFRLLPKAKAAVPGRTAKKRANQHSRGVKAPIVSVLCVRVGGARRRRDFCYAS
jgi:hypothetical protein